MHEVKTAKKHRKESGSMQKLLKAKISLMLSIVLVLVSIGGTWAVTYVSTSSEAAPVVNDGNSTQKTDEELYAEAVKDAMTVEPEEILPLVSLDEDSPYGVYDEQGRILLLTFHKYPDSYPDGNDVKIEWGEVWTFTGGELADWYNEHKDSVNDWPARLRQLIGLTPDNQATHFTAMWVNPEDVLRPAYVQEIGEVQMTSALSENTDEAFKEWFDSNIIWSYFDSAYPWTRLGYTYDWAADAEDEYGLSEFLVADGSEVKVAYTVTTEEMLSMLEDGSWQPDANEALQDAA